MMGMLAGFLLSGRVLRLSHNHALITRHHPVHGLRGESSQLQSLYVFVCMESFWASAREIEDRRNLSIAINTYETWTC
jgi:hypothetical protein